ncbi:UNVERIFIED_CONTAM: hypothetical protein GTU68_036940 [Idotea baltica]|nr:hypothetical protein [Idotea baltica]
MNWALKNPRLFRKRPCHFCSILLRILSLWRKQEQAKQRLLDCR